MSVWHIFKHFNPVNFDKSNERGTPIVMSKICGIKYLYRWPKLEWWSAWKYFEDMKHILVVEADESDLEHTHSCCLFITLLLCITAERENSHRPVLSKLKQWKPPSAEVLITTVWPKYKITKRVCKITWSLLVFLKVGPWFLPSTGRPGTILISGWTAPLWHTLMDSHYSV